MFTDPLAADTDLDGLPDSTELELSTDPTSSDTDGDGIADARGRAVGENSTINDYRSPEITVTYANFNDTAPSANYRLIYRVEDPSGVDRTALLKEGDTPARVNFDGNPRTVNVVLRHFVDVLSAVRSL